MYKSVFSDLSKEELIALIQNKAKELGRNLKKNDFLSKNGLPSDALLFRIFKTKSITNVLIECGLAVNKFDFYSKEELLGILKDYYKEHGTSPKTKDMRSKNNLPSAQAFYTKFKTIKWNEILEIAELPFNHSNTYSEETAYKTLETLYKVNNRIPTLQEMRDSKCVPTFDYYYEKYGSLENIFYRYGFIDKPLTHEDKINLSIQVFKDFAEKNKRCPLIEEYKQCINNGYKIQTLQKVLDIDYLAMCREYLPEYADEEKEIVTKESIINELTRIYNLLDRPPKYNELKTYNCIYRFNLIQSRFDGMRYNDIIKSLGWIPSGSTSASKSEDVLLSEFEQLFIQVGRVPTNYDFENAKDVSTKSTYESKFGSIRNVCDLLCIDYDLHFVNSGIGFKCNDLNGGLCKSIAELDISNYYINNNINFVKEPKYSEIIDNSNRRFDWKLELNNKWYYVEYFGLYNRTGKGKIVREYRKKTRDKIGKIYKSGNIDNCIFVFPYDLKHKRLDEIFSKFINNNINIVS